MTAMLRATAVAMIVSSGSPASAGEFVDDERAARFEDLERLERWKSYDGPAGSMVPAAVREAPGSAPAAGTPAPASTGRPVLFVLQATLDHQFDEFATVRYANGHGESVGDAVVGIAAGAAVRLTPDRRYELQAIAGFRLARAAATNGDVTFREFPVDLTAHVNLGRWRLGAGPTLHLRPELTGTGAADGLDARYGSALGAVGLVEYGFGKLGVGLRAMWLELETSSGASIDASGVGFLVGAYL